MAGRVALGAGDLSSAEGLLRRAIASDTRQVSAFALLAQVFSQQQRLDAAVEEFDTLAKTNRGAAYARLMSAVAVHTAGKVPEAQRRYEAILKRDPRSALAANNLAAIYIDQGTNLAYAEKLTAVALEQLPEEAEVLDTIGSLYAKRRDYANAAKFFQQAVAFDPGNPAFHFRLGQAFASNNEPERARDAFQAALRLNGRYTEARTALSALGQ
jgi:tetratricopeptide (TPR) repeat protein